MSSRSPSNKHCQASILVAQRKFVVAALAGFLPVGAAVVLLEETVERLGPAQLNSEVAHVLAGVMPVGPIRATAINCSGGRVVNRQKVALVAVALACNRLGHRLYSPL